MANDAEMTFRYHCRSVPIKRWAGGGGPTSWVRSKGLCDSTSSHATEPPPICPIRTAMRAAVEPALDNTVVAGRARHASVLEELSAQEAQSLDAEEVRQGRCTSADARARAAEQVRPAQCKPVLPLLAELSMVPSAGHEDVCGGECTMSHAKGAFKDGWGAQQFRRASVFYAAAQLGCSYLHEQVSPMNANSQKHGVRAGDAERFFGLSDYCRPPNARRPPAMHCLEPLGPNWVDQQPLRSTYALAALCNATVGELIASWRRQVAGRMVTCTWGLRSPPRSVCVWVRTMARLRRQYLASHGGDVEPSLTWFHHGGAGHGGRAALGGRVRLGPHVALHIRRGDIRTRDKARYISSQRWSRILADLGSALAEVRRRWDGPEPLRPVVHVMSSKDYEDAKLDALPLDQWAASLALMNVSLKSHVDADPYKTMHHLVGADVLLKSNSGFSDTASLYSAGIKLVFFRTRDTSQHTQTFQLEPLGLRDDEHRDAFVCALLAHLTWRARHAKGFD